MKKISLLLFFLICLHAYSQEPPHKNSTIYNAGQAFTCIAVDTSGNVWAGTDKAGLFYLDKRSNPNAAFTVITQLEDRPIGNYSIQTIKADKTDKVWIGHAGTGGSASANGGIEMINIHNLSENRHFSYDRNAECLTFLEREGLGSQNISSIAVDSFNTIWCASRSHHVSSTTDFILTPGTFSYKRQGENRFTSYSTWSDYKNGNEAPELPYPAYTCNVPGSATPGQRRCESIACSNNEVWVSVYPYEYTTSRAAPGRTVSTEFFPARILRYDLNGQYLGYYTFERFGASPGGVFKAIYLTPEGNAWVGMSAGKGFAAKVKNCFALLNNLSLPDIFLPGTEVGLNAIWGNKSGQVFIGTNKGLIVFNGAGKISDHKSYTLYTTENSSLPSNNITGGVAENDTIIWVATDNGIIRIKSKNNFSLEDNYTICNKEDINKIEAQTPEDHKRLDWHEYEISTVICDQNSTNVAWCTARYVYNLMKEDVTLTTPTPFDFPYDNLSIPLLTLLSEEEKETIKYNVQNWDDTRPDANGYGGIQYINQVLTPAMLLKYRNCLPLISCFPTQKLPLVGFSTSTRQKLFKKAQQYNKPNVMPCATYRLYQSHNMIMDRMLYKIPDKTLCGGRLESTDYDPVTIFPDDKNLTITNYTLEGHLLHPGKVVRKVIEECGQVKVVTIGTGLNYCAETEQNNPLIESAAIQQGKMNGNGNTVVGVILFKNIDIRLKKTFETFINPILR
jgi:hypothetical protein